MNNFFKDFDKWNELKKKLNTSEKAKIFILEKEKFGGVLWGST